MELEPEHVVLPVVYVREDESRIVIGTAVIPPSGEAELEIDEEEFIENNSPFQLDNFVFGWYEDEVEIRPYVEDAP